VGLPQVTSMMDSIPKKGIILDCAIRTVGGVDIAWIILIFDVHLSHRILFKRYYDLEMDEMQLYIHSLCTLIALPKTTHNRLVIKVQH
jgi:hypothetical protein